MKEMEVKINERLTKVEAKIEDINPQEEIAALSERVSRLENRPANNVAPDNAEVLQLKKRLELQEKAALANNIIIKDLERGENSLLESVVHFLHAEFGVSNAVWDVRETSMKFNNVKTIVVKLNSRHVKEEIMRQKSKLGRRKIFIEHELSSTELEVYKEIKIKARELRDRGRAVKIGYRKIRLDGEWFFWDRSKKRLVAGRERSLSAAPATSPRPPPKN